MDTILLLGLVGMIGYHVRYRFNAEKKRHLFEKFSVKDPANQLRFVSAACFEKRKVMNKEEFHVFSIAEECVRSASKGFRIFSQTSLGEIVWSEDEKAYSSINSKRVDILVVGPYGHPALAIEYQGSGHFQGTTTAIRDAVKEEALRKAGIPLLAVHHGYDPTHLKGQIETLLDRA